MLTPTPLCESFWLLGFESSTGFLGTGGAGFRIIPDADDDVDATLEALDISARSSVIVLSPLRLLSNERLAYGSNGGGSMRGPVDTGCGVICRFRRSVGVWVRVGLGTTTQSGSLVGAKGFEGLEVLRVEFPSGGPTFDRTGRPSKDCQKVNPSEEALVDYIPLSNHHLRRSELAGGSPGAIESYPIRSSSSFSPFLALAVVSPTSALRFA